MIDPAPSTETILALEATDPIQVTTTKRTLTGVIYDHEHTDPSQTHRSPEPGHHTLLFARPATTSTTFAAPRNCRQRVLCMVVPSARVKI